jgi:hypothetical protein
MDSLFLNNIQSEPSIQTNVIKTEQIPKTNYDTDNDGVFDDVEKIFGTDINNPDTDNDGISDMQELEVYKTDPLIADTDNDGVNDIDEILAGTDPNNKFE